jgi:hypothetical protein
MSSPHGCCEPVKVAELTPTPVDRRAVIIALHVPTVRTPPAADLSATRDVAAATPRRPWVCRLCRTLRRVRIILVQYPGTRAYPRNLSLTRPACNRRVRPACSRRGSGSRANRGRGHGGGNAGLTRSACNSRVRPACSRRGSGGRANRGRGHGGGNAGRPGPRAGGDEDDDEEVEEEEEEDGGPRPY